MIKRIETRRGGIISVVHKQVVSGFEQWQADQRRKLEQDAENTKQAFFKPIQDIYNVRTNKYMLDSNYAVDWAYIVKLDAIYKGKERLRNIDVSEVIKGHRICERTLDLMEGVHKKMGSFRSCYSELFDLFAGERAKILEAIENRDELYAQWQRIERDGKIDRLVKVSAEAEYIKAKEKVDDVYNKALDGTRRGSGDIRAKLKGYADQYYKIDPTKIDNDTVKLLESGALDLADLKQLAMDNAGNYTMCKLIEKYTRNIGTTEARILADELKKQNTNTAEEDYYDKVKLLSRGITKDIAYIKASNKFCAENQQRIIDSIPNYEIAENTEE